MISPNGIAHIQLTVRDVATSRPFYQRLLVETFGVAIQYDIAGQIFYCIGARTARSSAPGRPATAPEIWAASRASSSRQCVKPRFGVPVAGR